MGFIFKSFQEKIFNEIKKAPKEILKLFGIKNLEELKKINLESYSKENLLVIFNYMNNLNEIIKKVNDLNDGGYEKFDKYLEKNFNKEQIDLFVELLSQIDIILNKGNFIQEIYQLYKLKESNKEEKLLSVLSKKVVKKTIIVFTIITFSPLVGFSYGMDEKNLMDDFDKAFEELDNTDFSKVQKVQRNVHNLIIKTKIKTNNEDVSKKYYQGTLSQNDLSKDLSNLINNVDRLSSFGEQYLIKLEVFKNLNKKDTTKLLDFIKNSLSPSQDLRAICLKIKIKTNQKIDVELLLKYI